MKSSSGIGPIVYEAAQETLALLKILALGNRQIEQGRTIPAAEAFRRLRGKKPRR